MESTRSRKDPDYEFEALNIGKHAGLGGREAHSTLLASAAGDPGG